MKIHVNSRMPKIGDKFYYDKFTYTYVITDVNELHIRGKVDNDYEVININIPIRAFHELVRSKEIKFK